MKNVWQTRLLVEAPASLLPEARAIPKLDLGTRENKGKGKRLEIIAFTEIYSSLLRTAID